MRVRVDHAFKLCQNQNNLQNAKDKRSKRDIFRDICFYDARKPLFMAWKSEIISVSHIRMDIIFDKVHLTHCINWIEYLRCDKIRQVKDRGFHAFRINGFVVLWVTQFGERFLSKLTIYIQRWSQVIPSHLPNDWPSNSGRYTPGSNRPTQSQT